MLECDDGNLNDGDGCSHDCKVEENFLCYRQLEGPDVCRETILPEASIKVLRGNRISVVFSKFVFPTHSSNLVQHKIRQRFDPSCKDNAELSGQG